ncbi:MAG: hypothetical protein V3S00_04195 [Dehalococcoidia bacterium]
MGVKMLCEDAQSRQCFEVVAEEFGPGVVSPVEIVVRAESGIDDSDTVAGIYRLTNAIEDDERFAGAVSLNLSYLA